MERLYLLLDVLPRQEAAGLAEDFQEPVELVPRGERHRDVDCDDDVGAHLPDDVDRQVRGDSAVDEKPVVQLHRRQEAGDRHARADRARQVARAEDDGLARLEVRGDGAKGDREPIEVPDRRGGPRHPPEVVPELLAGNEPGGNDELAVREAQLDVDEVAGVVLLSPEGPVLPRRDVREDTLPVDRPELLPHLRRRHPDRVESAGERPAARPGHAVDRDPQLLEDLQDTDERSASRSASGEGEADARPRRCAGRGRIRLLSRERARPGHEQKERRQDQATCNQALLRCRQSTRGR